MQDNLSNRIHDATFTSESDQYLTRSERESFLGLLSKGCRKNTRIKLRLMVSNVPLSNWTNYGIYKRVTFNDGQVDYICGQSWNDEIRTLRKCILG